MIDPITEADLSAYVDGELDAMRRVEVEAHLARHPEDAARVMADLRDRDALREAFAPQAGPTPGRLVDHARRVDRALAWSRLGARLRRAAAVVFLVGAGWLAHTETGTFGVPDTIASPIDPALVQEARLAHQTALIRSRSASQRATSSYDRADLERATGLTLPALPEGWSVRDVQVFPARDGAGVEVEIDAGPLGEFALFAMGSPTQAASEQVTPGGDHASLYWQIDRTAFALSGGRTAEDLRTASTRLLASLR